MTWPFPLSFFRQALLHYKAYTLCSAIQHKCNIFLRKFSEFPFSSEITYSLMTPYFSLGTLLQYIILWISGCPFPSVSPRSPGALLPLFIADSRETSMLPSMQKVLKWHHARYWGCKANFTLVPSLSELTVT